MHSTSSSLQLVHGAPCSTTLHLTLRDRQHWHAFDALRFTLFAGLILPGFRPAASAVRLDACDCSVTVASGEPEESDILATADKLLCRFRETEGAVIVELGRAHEQPNDQQQRI